MIKIIKQGKKPEEKTCSNCGCVFSYEEEDIKSEVDSTFVLSSNPPKTKINYYVICPYCNKNLPLVPAYVVLGTAIVKNESLFVNSNLQTANFAYMNDDRITKTSIYDYYLTEE